MFLFPSYYLMAGIYSKCDKHKGEPTVLLPKVVELLGLIQCFSTHVLRGVLYNSDLSASLPKEGLRGTK